MPTLVVAILLLGSLVTSCMQLDGRKNEAWIYNESGVAVEILWSAPGSDDLHYADMRPGDEIALTEYVNRCTPSNMVAKTAEGLELARTQKPLCGGDVWVIGPPGAPSPG